MVAAPAAAAIAVAGAVAAAGSPQTEGGGGPPLLADRRAGVPALFAGRAGTAFSAARQRPWAGLVPQLPPATAAERSWGPTGRVRGPTGTDRPRPASPGAPHRISKFTGWLNINGKRSVNLSSFTMEASLADGEPDRILLW